MAKSPEWSFARTKRERERERERIISRYRRRTCARFDTFLRNYSTLSCIERRPESPHDRFKNKPRSQKRKKKKRKKSPEFSFAGI